jgi:hypothetical protein
MGLTAFFGRRWCRRLSILSQLQQQLLARRFPNALILSIFDGFQFFPSCSIYGKRWKKPRALTLSILSQLQQGWRCPE